MTTTAWPICSPASAAKGGEAIFAAVVQLVPIAVALSEQYGGPHGLEIVVVDRAAATVMSRSIEPDEWAAAPMAGTEFAAALGDGDRSDLDGVRRIYEVGVLESLGWEVHVGADRAAALAEADALFDTVVLAVGIGLAGALLASLGIYLIIVRPIRRLQRAITSASETMESPAPVAPSGPEEVADLARQFNRMTDSVQSEFARRKAAEAERDRLQHQLSRIERLESLGQLAGGMAHDFNNMLGVMLNYAVFVKEEVEAAALADETRWTPVLQDLTAIEDAVARSASLTRQLLAFARCDVAEPSGIQINETIETLAEMLTRTLGEHVRLQLNVGESPWTVRIDPRKLEQILVNLAANARDAMPEGGTLAIDSSNVDVDDDFAASRPGLVAGRYVRLRVSDTGSGMDPAVIEHAFEPLFTTKSVGRGTGLGLSTVYGIVTQAGGHISIYSEVGQGTTFSILLPAIEAAEPVPAPIAAPVAARAAGGSETVLVVEDDRTLLEVADRILSREGYRTLTAADGRSALQLARRHPGAIQLLLTDMVLPDMSGRELAEVLQGETPGIKVLYASGYAAPILAARATPVSAGSILEKPFPASDLLSKVRAALG